MATIEITGLEDLQGRLNLLQRDVAKSLVLNAVRQGSAIIANAMREQAPERPPSSIGGDLPPGALRADIRVRARLDRDNIAVAHIGPGKHTAYVARFVEYGHVEISGKTRSVVGHVPAHPFLRPAFDRSKADAIRQFRQTMREEFGRATK